MKREKRWSIYIKDLGKHRFTPDKVEPVYEVMTEGKYSKEVVVFDDEVKEHPMASSPFPKPALSKYSGISCPKKTDT